VQHTGGPNPSNPNGSSQPAAPSTKLPPKSQEAARVQARLQKKRTIDNEGCWLWTGELNDKGYGYMRAKVNGKIHRRVHRISFMVWKGLIPTGYAVHHACGKRRCFNPDHLQLVTEADNNVEMLQRQAYKATITDLRKQVTSLERKVKRLERKLSEREAVEAD